jgi:hypothetical protein
MNTMVNSKMRVVALIGLCLLGAANGFQPVVSRSGRAIRNEFPVASRSRLFTPLAASTDDKLVAPTLSKWDPTNWTPKRLHNSPLFRSAAILAALAAAGVSTKSPLTKISAKAGATAHLLSFATWFGTVFYTTFIAGITMYKNLPRQTFGKLQSKLFPKYFNLCSVAIVVQMVTLTSLPSLGQRATVALGTALAMTLLNQFILEPKSTKIMFDRYELEDTQEGKESDEYKKLASSFGKFHGMSSLTNLIALCGAVAHGFYLASALVA